MSKSKRVATLVAGCAAVMGFAPSAALSEPATGQCNGFIETNLTSTSQGDVFTSPGVTVTDGDPVVITGTSGSDVIIGSNGDDSIGADQGADTICARKGDDQVSAGDGDDYAAGGTGDNAVFGGGGDDFLVTY